MTKLRDLRKKWTKDPEFRTAYDALEEEFTLASALIEARAKADMTQEHGRRPWAYPRLRSRAVKEATDDLTH